MKATHLRRLTSSQTWCGERIENIETLRGPVERTKSTTQPTEVTCLRCMSSALNFHEGPAAVQHLQRLDELGAAESRARNLEHARSLAFERVEACRNQLQRMVDEGKYTNPNERVVVARDMAELALGVLRPS